MPDSPEIIVLASRFEVNESGHFYWFTKSIERELINSNLPFKVLSRNFAESSQEQFSDWRFLPTNEEWGKDTGTISPLKLVKLIEKEVLAEIRSGSRAIIYTYETSFSLLAALIIILYRNSNITAAANMLDTGYWQRFFNWKIFSWAPLRSSIKFALKFVDKRLMFYANMPNQAEIISKQIGYPVNSFPHITALNPAGFISKDTSITFSKGKLPNILIFTWPDDLPFVCTILKQMSQSSPSQLSQVTIHTKKLSDQGVINSYVTQENIQGVNLITGTQSEEEYINLIQQNDVTLFPYTDKMHFTTGSGRVIDSLILGRPVILSSESGSCLHARKVGACFTFDGISPLSVLEAIDQFQLSPFFSNNSKKEYQADLKSAAALEFSVGGLLDNIISTSDERLAHVKMNQSPRKINFALITVVLEVVWITLNTYQKVPPLIKKTFKLVKHQ
jgi:hypothetical protein